MNKQNQQKLSSDSSRRKFLTRSATGVALASLPAKSVWATGVTGSMVASGHGSDMAGGKRLVVKWPSYWVKNISFVDKSTLNSKFSTVFGGKPFKSATKKFDGNLTVKQVLIGEASKSGVYGGPKNVNRLMISAYLSAMYSDSATFSVHFPVVGPKRAFKTQQMFGQKLYAMAIANPSVMGTELQELHKDPVALAARLR
ncbi:hypothetical protein [Agaribacter marinus]|uniref:Uncharacterized protein n=1 Tax=Agaribacter marinus TaxID=1431249 RepID=A0AA37SWK9_9ALTE|nr:hypothetical protein [Agaribacter marinus]GLR70917.1 hypothetical protein GCM10007852_18250 [Agaribacter marinus]